MGGTIANHRENAMKRQVISTDRCAGCRGTVFAGCAVRRLGVHRRPHPLDPATGRLVEGSIEAQTRQVLNNLKAIVEVAGSSMSDVVKTTVFVVDMADFKAMNGVYAEFFPTAPPARSTVQVGGLPLGARVEIEAVAVRRTRSRQRAPFATGRDLPSRDGGGSTASLRWWQGPAPPRSRGAADGQRGV